MPAEFCQLLLVEDREADARLIQEMLATTSHTQFNITVASCLSGAVQRLDNADPPADIVLLDLSLPDSRGLGGMTAIRRAAPTIPVVVLTATDDEQLAVAAVRAGAQDWLTKSQVTTQLLERALRYAIQRHQMQEELKHSEERFLELAENMNEVFWTRVGETHQLTYVSPAFERVWGVSCREACQHANLWFDAIHPDQQAAVHGAYDAIESTGTFDIDYRIMRPDGTVRWVRDRGVHIPNGNSRQRRFAGIAEDITAGKELERQIAELTVKEQRRIGEELHDSLGQQLTGIGFLAKTLERKLEAAGSTATSSAADLEQNVGIAQRQLRRLVKGLMPVEVDADGLMTALDQLARTTERLCNVVCTFHCLRRVAVGDNNTATHLYHIVQEAVHNAVRHSGARHIEIRIAENGNSLLLQVDDDGTGLADLPGDGDGMGLRIMNHRAAVVGAAVELGASASGGVRVLCTLPRESGHVATTP